MAYYISQGKVETPSRRGGQFCCSFVCKFTSVSQIIRVPKIIKIQCRL